MVTISELLIHPDVMSEEMRIKNRTFQYCQISLWGRKDIGDSVIVDIALPPNKGKYKPKLCVEVLFYTSDGEIYKWFIDSSDDDIDNLFAKVVHSLGQIGWSVVNVTEDEDMDPVWTMQRELEYKL